MGYRVFAFTRGKAKEEEAKKLGAHEYFDTTEEGFADKVQVSKSCSRFPVPLVPLPLVTAMSPTALLVSLLCSASLSSIPVSLKHGPSGLHSLTFHTCSILHRRDVKCFLILSSFSSHLFSFFPHLNYVLGTRRR